MGFVQMAIEQRLMLVCVDLLKKLVNLLLDLFKLKSLSRVLLFDL